jgi:hypothetical protein
MSKIFLFFFCISLLMQACAPFVPVRDLSKVPQDTLNQAQKIRTYTINNPPGRDEIMDYFGDIETYSCKFMPFDPPASQGNALTQLKIIALEKGADAIMDLTFDKSGTDAFGTNCWESVKASGVAIKLKPLSKVGN